MAGQQKISKGLPRRCSNAHLKEARAKRWKGCQERKRLRQEAQDVAHKRNLKLRADGQLTPWEVACGHGRESSHDRRVRRASLKAKAARK